MDDAGIAFLTEFPERGLDLHPDLDVLRLHVDQLRGEPDPLVHLDDRHHVRLLHLELGRRIVDDRVRHDGPTSGTRPAEESRPCRSSRTSCRSDCSGSGSPARTEGWPSQSPRSKIWTTAVAPVPPSVCVSPRRAPTTCRLPPCPR